MEVMRRITAITFVLCGFALVSTFTRFVLWQGRSDLILNSYRFQLAFILVVDAVYATLSKRYLASENPRLGQATSYMVSYIALMMAVNAWITVADFAEMRRYFFLLVATFMLFGLFFVPPEWSIPAMVIVFAATMSGLTLVGQMSPIQIVTLFFYLLVILAVSVSNYAERVRAAQASEHLVNVARTDEVTGLPNRTAFGEDAHTYAGGGLTLLLCDIDEFKYYNDLYGHLVGDDLLRSFAQCLVDAFGEGHVYRFGGDQFIALMPGNENGPVREAIDRWQASFHDVELDGKRLLPTCSAGSVHSELVDEQGVHDLLRIADVLLFRAKDNGRNQVTFAEYSDGLMRESIAMSATYDMPNSELDELTGLPDKNFFFEHCSEIAPVVLQKGHSVSFVYFNVANIKDFNARYGYAEGDRLLVLVANTLREVFPGRMLSRFGDDRFCLMAYEVGLPEAIERACSIVRDAYHGRLTTLHAGVYRYTSPDVSVRHGCDCAHLACDSLHGHYDASYCYYTEELGDKMARHNRVLERFEEALENGYIKPFYQPIIRSASDFVCEFEVLARWIDPVEGILSPADFIPALEDAHLIHLLDLHIVDEVCKNYLRSMEGGYATSPVSINFSRLDFEACDLVEEVVGRMDCYGVPHGLIRVELTESAFAEDAEGIKESLVRFRQAGLQVWMDDFGSGYSALNILREYEFDLVKFDMSFLHGLDVHASSDPSGIMLVNLINMVKELGLQTLVEGIETADQFAFLRGIACEKFQGFVFGRPQSYEEICARLDDHTYRIEEREKRGYYDQIGKINLIQPVEPGSDFDPTGIAEGVPVAVLEHGEDGNLRYLEYNAAYAQRIEGLGIAGIEASEGLLNSTLGSWLESYDELSTLIARTDDWVRLGTGKGTFGNGYVRCVARVPNSHTFALLFCAPPQVETGE